MSFGFASKITSITKNEQRTKQPATATTEPGEQSAANSRSTTSSHPPPIPNRDFESFERWGKMQGQPDPTITRVLNALNNRIGDFPNARSARTEFKNLQQLESESIQGF